MPQSTAFCIDYLTMTAPRLELSSELELLSMIAFAEQSELGLEIDQHPMNGYRTAVRSQSGAIGQCAPLPMGAYLSWSGQALNGQQPLEIAQRLLDVDFRCTRIDLTCDFRGYETTVTDYYEEFAADQCLTMARTHDHHRSQDKGETLYIGSQSSERFMRIYNKRAERAAKAVFVEGDETWVRAELVLGGDVARGGIKWVMQEGLDAGVSTLIKGYADFVNVSEYTHMSEQSRSIVIGRKADNNTEKWLIEICAPALAKAMKQNPDVFDKFKRALEIALAD